MAKLIVVKGDAVAGTDTHPASGPAADGSAFSGTGEYAYAGTMAESLSAFVQIDGKAVALVTSTSTLKSTETTPGGGHHPASGKNFKPSAPAPVTASLTFLPPVVGTGTANAAAGSGFLTIGGTSVLLDGDKIDTCDGTGSANSTVTASGQSFVTCSE